jgi:hypothetical protein
MVEGFWWSLVWAWKVNSFSATSAVVVSGAGSYSEFVLSYFSDGGRHNILTHRKGIPLVLRQSIYSSSGG